jgi:16S rRNA (adenine1518-N6/adenine1519-N6)-dimethyltransferase
VIRLQRKAVAVPVRSERALLVLVKTAFNQRRKMMRNAVKGLFSPEELADPLFDQRAEQLSVEQFAALTFRMK